MVFALQQFGRLAAFVVAYHKGILKLQTHFSKIKIVETSKNYC